MRVVLDTNVLISAVVFQGLPASIVEHARVGSFRLILSPQLLEELRRILREKFQYTDAAIHKAEVSLRDVSEVVEPRETVSLITAEPSDNRVLEAAMMGKADMIVTGDHAHLIPLGSFQSIPIVTPRQLLELVEKR
jgi:putative PIN family toxin of toxin-antitoxin system